jgi:cyclic pyranopterin phosphate synthase
MSQLSHLDEQGRARMVDVSSKDVTSRIAIARGTIHMRAETLALILEDKIEKGDVFSVARVAGIMAAKKTAELIPMCHPLMLTAVEVELTPARDPARVDIEATVRVTGKTGVEMEAMTAAAVAGLTIYDMCKAVDREMTIGEIRLAKKSGGKSGTFIRKSKVSSVASYLQGRSMLRPYFLTQSRFHAIDLPQSRARATGAQWPSMDFFRRCGTC